jgi:DNA-binding transcriptional LysR family regulator
MLDQLRHFLHVEALGSFTAAARRAHVSQPALTSSIRRLEEQLGARLFDRGRWGATLTLAGRTLLPHARAAVIAVDEGAREVGRLVALESGEVRVGGGSTACTYLLPPVLSQFRRQHPGVRLVLRELPEELAVDAFERGELDLVVAGGAKGERFRDEEVVLVAAPGRDVSALPFVTFLPGSAVRTLLDRHFPERPVAMELASIGGVKGAVRAGLGVALVSRSAVATDLALGRLVEVRTSVTPIPRPLRLVHRGLDRLSEPARALRAMLLADAPRRKRRPEASSSSGRRRAKAR